MVYDFKGSSDCLCRLEGPGRARQPSLKAIRLIQRDGGRWHQGGSSGGGRKQKEAGTTLKAESIRLLDGLDLGCGGRREVKDDSRVCGLSY